MGRVLIPQLPLGNVFIRRIPTPDPLSQLEMFVVDMVEPLIPSLYTSRFQLDNRFAEATPEARLPISSNAGLFALLAGKVVILHVVFVSYVCLKGIPPVEDLSALMYFARRTVFRASPGLESLIMLGVFVSFPVVLATKRLEAIGMRAPPGACVALLVFSSTSISMYGT